MLSILEGSRNSSNVFAIFSEEALGVEKEEEIDFSGVDAFLE